VIPKLFSPIPPMLVHGLYDTVSALTVILGVSPAIRAINWLTSCSLIPWTFLFLEITLPQHMILGRLEGGVATELVEAGCRTGCATAGPEPAEAVIEVVNQEIPGTNGVAETGTEATRAALLVSGTKGAETKRGGAIEL